MYIYILHRTNIVKYLRFVMLYTDPVEIAIKRIDETNLFLLLLDLRSRECISRNLHVSTRQKSNFRTRILIEEARESMNLKIVKSYFRF